ncbi:MAG: metallophosphoesterase [Candidatus Gastranaerophilales bacterium]|nr:metallophosphoesterase [Candidatus Gastranaerophilales bacterium]
MKIAEKFIELLLAVFLISGCANASEIKFIHITDTNMNVNNAGKLLKTIRELNQYKDVDFIVFGGNNISKTNIDNLNTFLYLLKKVNKKTVVLLGSTDVLSSVGIDKKYYLKRVKRARLMRLSYHSSKPYYTFAHKGCRFIVMDGSKQYFQTSNGYYNKNELIWLDKQLNKYKDENVVILQHFPLIDTNSKWLETAKKDEYLEVLSKHKNVKIIVSGHYGNNSEITKDGIYHIVTESYSKNGAYKIIQLDFSDDFIGTYLVK